MLFTLTLNSCNPQKKYIKIIGRKKPKFQVFSSQIILKTIIKSMTSA